MVKSVEFVINSTEDLSKVCEYILPMVNPGTIFLLDGKMSAGKTTLVSKLLQKLNIKNVSSPTYSIHQIYNFEENIIHHIDLHRLENSDDIESSGIWDLFQNIKNIFFVEWAQKIEISNWPVAYKKIHIQITQENLNQRKYIITNLY